VLSHSTNALELTIPCVRHGLLVRFYRNDIDAFIEQQQVNAHHSPVDGKLGR